MTSLCYTGSGLVVVLHHLSLVSPCHLQEDKRDLNIGGLGGVILSGDIVENVLLTAVVKLVDFQLVDFAEGGDLPQLYVVAVLWNDGGLSTLRVGVPKGVRGTW